MGRRDWWREDSRDEWVLILSSPPHLGGGTWTGVRILIRGSRPLITDPATEEELGTIPEMGLEETKAAIAAAGKAFQTWGKTTAKVSYLQGKWEYVDRAFRCLDVVPARHSHQVLWVDARTPRRLGSHYRASCRMVGCD